MIVNDRRNQDVTSRKILAPQPTSQILYLFAGAHAMDPGIRAAIQILPKYETVIKELALQNESFRSLCGDIADAKRALQHRITSDAPEDAAQRVEYRHLVENLEAELRQAILAWETQSKGRNSI